MLEALIGLLMASNNPSVLTADFWLPIVEAAESPKEKWIDALAECESHASSTVKILDVNGRYSYGLLQFQQSTWLRYKKLGTTKKNIYDPGLQKVVAQYILDNPKETGGWRNWYNCAKITGLNKYYESL